MKHNGSPIWWNTDMFGDTEPATTTSAWVAAQNPNVVLLPTFSRKPELVEDVSA